MLAAYDSGNGMYIVHMAKAIFRYIFENLYISKCLIIIVNLVGISGWYVDNVLFVVLLFLQTC